MSSYKKLFIVRVMNIIGSEIYSKDYIPRIIIETLKIAIKTDLSGPISYCNKTIKSYTISEKKYH